MHPGDLAIATYDTHLQAQHAVDTLQRAGFDMRRVSFIGRDSPDERVLGFFNAGDRAAFFGRYGAFWGSLGGTLFGAAFLFVPILGHVVVFGPLASTIVDGLEGAAIGGGVSALLGALSAIGIPRNSMLRYTSAIRADRLLLIVHGEAAELRRAGDVLAGTGMASFERPAAEPARA